MCYYLYPAARESSYILCYVGFLFAVMQGGVIGRLIRPRTTTTVTTTHTKDKQTTATTTTTSNYTIARERTIIIVSFIVLSAALLFWGVAWSSSILFIALLPFSLAAGSLNTLINSLITKVFISPSRSSPLTLFRAHSLRVVVIVRRSSSMRQDVLWVYQLQLAVLHVWWPLYWEAAYYNMVVMARPDSSAVGWPCVCSSSPLRRSSEPHCCTSSFFSFPSQQMFISFYFCFTTSLA